MSNEGAQALSYAVRPRVLAQLLGQLALVLLVLLTVPAAVALFSGETALALRFAAVLVVLGASALSVLRLKEPELIQHNEAMAVAALAFVIAPLCLVYPFMGTGLSFADALFEAVSGVTTTGLTVLADPQTSPAGLLFARAWSQWFGGLGIVVLSVGLVMGSTVAARRLAESAVGEVATTTAKAHARRMLLAYAVLTVATGLLAWVVIGDALTAWAHVLAGVSTGGFSTFSASLGGLETWPQRYVLIGVGLCGALPLPLWYALWRTGWRDALGDVELRAVLGACLAAGLLVTATLYLNGGMDVGAAAAQGMLLGVSAQTTTGFAGLDVGTLDPLTKSVTMAFMAIGGGVGSTAGGIKVLRLLIVLRMLQLVLRRTAMSAHAVQPARLAGRQLEPDELGRALMLFVLFGAAAFVSWLAFVAYGYPPLDSLFEVVSALGTVGLSTGISSSELQPLLKAVLCADMLLGRLEFVALLVLFYPPTWIGRRA